MSKEVEQKKIGDPSPEAIGFAKRRIALKWTKETNVDTVACTWQAGYVHAQIDERKKVNDGKKWIEIAEDEKSLPPESTVVLGYNEKWIDEDFNPEGIRESFYNDGNWHSCIWDNDHDTWNNDFFDKNIPPTHWMQRPSPPVK